MLVYALAGLGQILVAIRIALVVAYIAHIWRVCSLEFARASVHFQHVIAKFFSARRKELLGLLALEVAIVAPVYFN